MSGMKMKGGWDWRDEFSVNNGIVREGGERRFENIDRRVRYDGSRKLIPQPSMKMPNLSFDGGSHLGVPCMGGLPGRVEREGGKISSD